MCREKKQPLLVYIQEIEPYINADINRRLFCIQGVNNRQKKITDLDLTSYEEEKWVRGNFHFKGPKRLRKSISVQTDSENMITDNVNYQENKIVDEYKFVEKDENDNDNENILLGRAESTGGICKDMSTGTEDLEILSMDDPVSFDLPPDIFNLPNILCDYPKYPKNFPHLQEASIRGIIIDHHS